MKERWRRSRLHHRHHNDVKTGSPEASELAAQLAPPEEREAAITDQSSNNDGTIIVDSGPLKIPASLTDKEGIKLFRLDPIAILILILVLAFIAIIAYLISQMPDKLPA